MSPRKSNQPGWNFSHLWAATSPVN